MIERRHGAYGEPESGRLATSAPMWFSGASLPGHSG